MPRDRVVVYSSLDYLISGPQRDGDLPDLLRRLRQDGVTRVGWVDRGDINDHRFESIGLIVLARMAGLDVEGVDAPRPGDAGATLLRARDLGGAAPCARMENGMGVWVRLGPPQGGGAERCP